MRKRRLFFSIWSNYNLNSDVTRMNLAGNAWGPIASAMKSQYQWADQVILYFNVIVF